MVSKHYELSYGQENHFARMLRPVLGGLRSVSLHLGFHDILEIVIPTKNEESERKKLE